MFTMTGDYREPDVPGRWGAVSPALVSAVSEWAHTGLDVEYWAAARAHGMVPFTCEDCGSELWVIDDAESDPCHDDVGYDLPIDADSPASLAACEHTWGRCRAVQGLPSRTL
jgi:hypothetical protein